MTNKNTYGKDPLEYVRRAIPWALGYLAGNKVDFLYRGPDTPYFTTTCDQPAEMLTVDYLENDGKNPLDVLLTIAFRLGFEFGIEKSALEVGRVQDIHDRLSGLVEKVESMERVQSKTTGAIPGE